MKKTLVLLLMSFLFLIVAGCKKDEPALVEPPTSTTSMQETTPPDAVAPNTMKIDGVFDAINLAVAESGIEPFSKRNAAITDVKAFPEDDDILYEFERSDIEIVIIASRQTDSFTGAYFRSLYDDELTEANMSSFAGLLMKVLEPNEYPSMGEIIIAGMVSKEKEARGSGEYWTVLYREGLINVTPK